MRVAARARTSAGRCARRRSRVRARAVPGGAEHGAPARADLALPPAGALLHRAAEDAAHRGRDHRDPALGTGEPRDRRRSLLHRLRVRPRPGLARCGARNRRRGRRSGARAALRHQRLHPRARPVAERGRPLLGGLDRVSLAARSRRDVRLLRLAHAAARARRPDRARAVAPLGDRVASRGGRHRSGRRRAGDAPPDVQRSRATSSRSSRSPACPSGCFRSPASHSPRSSHSPSPPGREE